MGRRLPLLVLALVTVVGLLARPAAAAASNDPELAGQWGLADIKAPEAWAKGKGAGIRVVVVSSGIAQHPDLTSKTDAGFDATGSDPAKDTSGRGTHLAGIVAAATNNGVGIAGVAPDARVVPFKAFESDSSVNGEKYLEAVRTAVDGKPQVVLVDVPEGFPSDAKDRLRQFLSNLGRGGASVVVGAGGIAVGDLPVLGVAATGAGGDQAPGTAGVGPQGIAAPGAGVLSTKVSYPLLGGDPTYEYGQQSGTAQAAAHAAGAVAILRGLGASASQANDLLRTTARKSANGGFGAGILDVAAAAAAYQAPATPATTATTKKATTSKPPATAKLPAGGTVPSGLLPSGAAGAPGGDIPEPGVGEEAVVPPGAEDFLDGPEGGAAITPTSSGEDRPFGALAVGFGLLFGVGTGLSVTFRRLADGALSP